MGTTPKRYISGIVLIAIAVVAVLFVFPYMKPKSKGEAFDSATYGVVYPKIFPGWHEAAHGPMLLARFENNEPNTAIMVGANHAESDTPVDSSFDTQSMVSILRDSSKRQGWTVVSVSEAETIDGFPLVFVHRIAINRSIWAAVGVRGNSNFLFGLLTPLGPKSEKAVADFKRFVRALHFVRNK